ncbi:MAG: alpha/beta fold hydrolase [Cyclobacteriaceae bacterium]
MAVVYALEKHQINGVDQWILFSGKNDQNPVLLFLHGGPGLPLFPLRKEIVKKTKLEDYFTVAYWEQRGSGKSFSKQIPDDSMHISQMEADTHVVVKLVAKKFAQASIYLMGHSWGSLLGLRQAAQHPELITAYLGIGQLINALTSDRQSYDFTLQQARKQNKKAALKQLEKIGPPPFNVNKLMQQRGLLQKFDGTRRDGGGSLLQLVKDAFTTPEYRLKEVFSMLSNALYSLNHLWDELYQYDLHEINKVEVPVYFLHGRHDHTVSYDVAHSFYEKLEAPKGKKFITFENSAHYPFVEEAEVFNDFLTKEFSH